MGKIITTITPKMISNSVHSNIQATIGGGGGSSWKDWVLAQHYVSETALKTINNQSIVGEGNIDVQPNIGLSIINGQLNITFEEAD